MGIEIKHCTSCGSDDIEVAGNRYLCKACGVTYEVTDAGTKVVSTDPFSKDRGRIDQLEKDVDALKKGKREPRDINRDESNDGEDEGGFVSIEGDEG